MPSASSTTSPPDVPQNVPSQASSVSSQSASARPSTEPTEPTAPAAQPSRLKAHAHRAWRTTRAWLAPAPAATTSAALIVLVNLALAPWGHRGEIALSAFINQPQRVWTLLTAWAAPGLLVPVASAIMLLSVGVLLERLLGTRRWLVTSVVSTAGGIALAQALYPFIGQVWETWSPYLVHAPIRGVTLPITGLVAASTSVMRPSWRRRVRLAMFAVLIVSAAVTGTVGALARLGTGVIGLIVGVVLERGQQTAPSQELPRRVERELVAFLVACWAVSCALAVVSNAAGPLADARFGLTPAILPKGAAVSPVELLLLCMPALLQLVLADGLRRGRRSAALGTIALQIFLGACAAVFAFVDKIDAQHPEPAPETPQPLLGWALSGHLLIPLLLNIVVISLVVWKRGCFTLGSCPGVIRRAVTAWVLTVVGGAAVTVLGGMLIPRDFAPYASWPDLLETYVSYLLPVSTGGILGLIVAPLTPLAHLLIKATPVLVWLLTILWVWLAQSAPARTRVSSREELTELVRARGAGTLGWMLTWEGNEAWVNETGTAGFSYRPSRDVALTVGDPAAADADVAQAVRDFAGFATDAGLIPALYSVHAPAMEAARAMGWTILQVAEEAVLDLPDLAFRGKAYQDVRTALNHARKEGIEAVWTTFRDCPAGRRDQIRAISQAWASDKPLPEMGFTLGGLAELDDSETRLLLAVDADGTVQGVTSWLPVYRDGRIVGLTLDFMRRREGGFRPVMEFLIGRAAQDAQAEGLEILSLSGAPLSRSAPADGGASSRFDPLLNLLASVLEPAYGFGSLHAYKRKFKPRSVPMYLAVPDLVDLPTVGIAIARAYLPGLKPSQTARFAQVLMNRD
ncbi:bifunctional lysylphosphatidylglycerol flippase/synthetase MprF [Actinomyces naeslundii]|uniref:bifunctional lysylphosphatidylglycerol flippase/synthetase MprF n=1 Tax=Actinomyces naeslundii TaxID=1655 RepID=UPI00096DF8B7|nr:DUF2156 domain-containing protein [Actinomyces naeslundii]OMG37004.1 hypothetical protein BKH25_00575 [Actinomyces naeslundii]